MAIKEDRFVTTEDRIRATLDQFSAKAKTCEPTATLVSELGLDSLDIVEMTLELEIEFNIEINDDSIERWVTLQDVIDTVKLETRGDAVVVEAPDLRPSEETIQYMNRHLDHLDAPTVAWLQHPDSDGGITTCTKHRGHGFTSDCAVCRKLAAAQKGEDGDVHESQ